jgi:hypothetical protein
VVVTVTRTTQVPCLVPRTPNWVVAQILLLKETAFTRSPVRTFNAAHFAQRADRTLTPVAMTPSTALVSEAVAVAELVPAALVATTENE